MSLAAQTIIQDAFGLLNVYMPGETASNADANYGLRALNGMMGQWAQQNLTIPAVTRTVVDLVANQTSYTIGSGGNFNIARPPNQNSIVGAALVLTTSSPLVEVPLNLYTDQQYNSIPIKGLTSGQPTGLWYNPTYSATFGTIFLWPIPNVSTNDLALYTLDAVVEFAALTTAYNFPPGYPECMVYQLAKRLCTPYGRELSAEARMIAENSLRILKRSNVKVEDMPNDFAGIGASGRYGYDINTDSYH